VRCTKKRVVVVAMLKMMQMMQMTATKRRMKMLFKLSQKLF